MHCIAKKSMLVSLSSILTNDFLINSRVQKNYINLLNTSEYAYESIVTNIIQFSTF